MQKKNKCVWIRSCIPSSLALFLARSLTASPTPPLVAFLSSGTFSGSSSWLPTPLVDLSFGKAPGATKTDSEIVAQTSADCCVYATPGLVGCIAAADSLVTGKVVCVTKKGMGVTWVVSYVRVRAWL